MWTRVILLCAMMLGGAILAARNAGPAVVPARENLAHLPYRIGRWQGREESAMSDRAVEMLQVSDYTSRTYTDGVGGFVGLYVGYHPRGGYHSPLNCLPGAGWNIERRGIERIPAPGAGIEVNRVVLIKGAVKQVVLYWYQGCGRVVASEYWGLIYGMWDKIRSGRTDGALVRIIAPARGLEPEAEEEAGRIAAEFARLLYPMLGRFIPE